MTTNSININIWDDYHDDGYVPADEIQETYAYVEQKMSDEDCKNVLEFLKKAIEGLVKPEWSLELSLYYYDSAKKYPNLVGTEHEYCLFKRWELRFKHLTHQAREYLVEELQKQQLSFNGMPLEIYSES